MLDYQAVVIDYNKNSILNNKADIGDRDYFRISRIINRGIW